MADRTRDGPDARPPNGARSGAARSAGGAGTGRAVNPAEEAGRTIGGPSAAPIRSATGAMGARMIVGAAGRTKVAVTDVTWAAAIGAMTAGGSVTTPAAPSAVTATVGAPGGMIAGAGVSTRAALSAVTATAGVLGVRTAGK